MAREKVVYRNALGDPLSSELMQRLGYPEYWDDGDPAGVMALLDALDEGHDVETWPEHDGAGPNTSNHGNERETTGPDGKPL